MAYKYIGNGAFIPGVPARDLTDEEVRKHGEKTIKDSGLYVSDNEQPDYFKKETRGKKTWRE